MISTDGKRVKGKTNYCYECSDFVVSGVLEVRFREDGIKRRTYLCENGHKFVTHELTIPPQPGSKVWKEGNV